MWVLYIYKNMWKKRKFWIFYEIFEADFEIKMSFSTKIDGKRSISSWKRPENPKNKFGQQIRNNQIVSWKCRILTRNLWKTIFHRKGPSYDIKLFCWV